MNNSEFRKEIFKIIYWFEETGWADKDITKMLRKLANKMDEEGYENGTAVIINDE